MFGLFKTCLVLSVGLSLAGCAPQAQPEPTSTTIEEQTVLTISGSGTTLPIIEELAEAYTQRHPYVTFKFDTGTNTGGGVKGVAQGLLDIAAANRPLSETELAEPVVFRPIAKDALAIATNGSVSTHDMHTEEVCEIYMGDLKSWDQVGGESSSPIVVLDRDEEDSARKFGLMRIMMGHGVEAQTIVLSKAKEMATALETTPNAIGYSTLGYLNATQPSNVRVVSLDGVKPGAASVASGEYPLYLTLGLVHRASPSAEVTGFMDFVASSDGQKVLGTLDVLPFAG